MFLNAPMDSTHVNARIRRSSLGTAPASRDARLFSALAQTSSLNADAASVATASSRSSNRRVSASMTSADAPRLRAGLLRICTSLRSLSSP